VNVDWTDWNALNTVTLKQNPVTPLKFDWESSFFYEFGVTRYFENGFALSAGYVYSENSVPEGTFNPVVPDSDRHIFSLGVGRKYKKVSWDACYSLRGVPSAASTIPRHSRMLLPMAAMSTQTMLSLSPSDTHSKTHVSTPIEPRKEQKRRTLLIVDDEEGPRQSLRVVFKNEYDLLLANDGATAIGLARKQKIDAAVIDIRMIGMSGIEVLQGLKAVDPHIEVIMLTAYETIDTVRQALRLGACDYLNKPFDIPTIRNAVANAMDRRSLSFEVKANAEKLRELQSELQNRSSKRRWCVRAARFTRASSTTSTGRSRSFPVSSNSLTRRSARNRRSRATNSRMSKIACAESQNR
jgi:DNA-binding NarL/FixJ family response regulator